MGLFPPKLFSIFALQNIIMKKIFTNPIILIAICFAYTVNCNAQWSTDPNVDNSLNATLGGAELKSCTDGHGGAIYSWLAYGTKGYLVYANRIDSVGNIRWSSSGILLHSDSLGTAVLPNPSICEDGKGGCYIAFSSNTIAAHPIICQHLDSNGTILWGAQGKQISTSLNTQYYETGASLVNDNNKGVFIAFFASVISDTTAGIYAQRLSFTGSKQWGNYGIWVEKASDERQPTAISDGQNGIAIAWTNYSFDGLGHQYQIRMNRLDHNGHLRFSFGSEKINTIEAIGFGPFIRLMLTNQRNYIIEWTSDNINTNRVFSQKIDSMGNFLWGNSEIKVRDTVGEVERPDILSDGTGGAYYVWLDGRKINIASGIFAQHITSSGIRAWKSQGIQIDSNAGNNSPHIAPDVNNGMKLFWTNEPASRVYIQQLNKNGVALLSGTGVAVGAVNHAPSYYQQVLPASNNHDIIFTQYGNPTLCYAKYVPFNTLLPLKLISFNAVNKGSINLLSWQTTSEINTAYFSIERSEDGKIFNEINKVKSKNGTAINNYNYEDGAISTSDVYYRLKEIDEEGKFTYSNVVAIHQNTNSFLRIVPNPATKNCTVYFNPVTDRNVVLRIFDMNGRQQKQVLLSVKQTSAIIDVSTFSMGTYFCNLEATGKIVTQKLIVVK